MTIEYIQQLVATDESRTVEVKKTTGELQSAMHSLCAMLNSDGGYVIIGIHPTTLRILGQKVVDKTRQEIANEIRKIEPHITIAAEYIDVPDTDGCQIIVFHADKSIFYNAPYVYDGKPYYKVENTTVQMPQQLYEQMLRARDAEMFRWDAQTAQGVTVADLSEKRIRAAVSLGIKNGRVNASAEGETITSLLSRFKLLNDGLPTNAAVMLFAESTDRFPEMELRMGCFRGTNKNIFVDNKSETGNFFDLLDAGIAFCVRNLRLSGEVKGLLREEKLEIPIEALREALINALCHRQYELTDGCVSLAIYDDRVEIVNPGRFPSQISPETIKLPHQSYPHNKLIARVLYLTTYLERWGSGAERIMQLCREQNISDPVWNAENDTVSIVFRRKPLANNFNDGQDPDFGGENGGDNSGSNMADNKRNNTQIVISNGGENGGERKNHQNIVGKDSGENHLTDRQLIIYNLIKANGENSTKELARTTGITRRTIERELSYLKSHGYIERKGTKGGIWLILK